MADNQLKNEIQSLRSVLDGLREDVSGILDAIRDSSEARIDSLQEHIRDDVNRGRESIRRQAGKARVVGRQAAEDVEAGISNHPYTSVATAFGVGFAVAKLLDLTTRRLH